MQRVMIIGGPGAGKSTFARSLGERTALPVYHVDRIIWTSGWVLRDAEDSARRAREIEAQEAWIFDGFLTATWPTRAARADTLIWLDLPIGLRIWRVLKRLVQNYGHVRWDLVEGCPEQVSREFLGFVWWMWQTRQSHRAELQDLISAHPHLVVHHLQSRAAVAQFLKRTGP